MHHRLRVGTVQKVQNIVILPFVVPVRKIYVDVFFLRVARAEGIVVRGVVKFDDLARLFGIFGAVFCGHFPRGD